MPQHPPRIEAPLFANLERMRRIHPRSCLSLNRFIVVKVQPLARDNCLIRANRFIGCSPVLPRSTDRSRRRAIKQVGVRLKWLHCGKGIGQGFFASQPFAGGFMQSPSDPQGFIRIHSPGGEVYCLTNAGHRLTQVQSHGEPRPDQLSIHSLDGSSSGTRSCR